MPEEITKEALDKMIREKSREEIQEHEKSKGKKDVKNMADESDEVKRLREEKNKRDIEDAMKKCMGDHCDLIADKAAAKVEKGMAVNISDLKAEISKGNKAYEALQKKLEEQDAHMKEIHKVSGESAKEIREFSRKFMEATSSEIIPHCENCGHDAKEAYVKEAGVCTNPICKSKFSSTDQKNGFIRCPACGADIEWKKKD